MDWTICSRETERDYTWDNTHASHPVAEYAQGIFAPGFEGSLTTSRFAALLRCPGSPQGVILCVSVSTARKDFRSRPIRTMVVLRAENPDEEKLIVSFFAECLRKSDTETLYAAASGVAKAVESLYQTKKPDEFLTFCKSLKPADGKECFPENYRCANPRDHVAARKWLADALPAAIAGNSQFLFVLTDRLPTDVLASLGSMFDRGFVQIFSKATTTVEKLPEPAPQKYVRAAAIGGAILLAILVAAIGPCSKTGREGPAHRDTNIVSRAIDGGEASTNSVPSDGRSGKSAGETRQGDSTTNAITAEAETALTITTNRLERGGMMKAKED